MRSRLVRIPFVFMLILGLVIGSTACSKPEPVKVAIMTKLEAGSLVGISEVDTVKYYLDSHGIDNIEYIPFDDGWNPEKIPDVYAAIRKQGIDIIITSHTSTCALELKKLTDQELDDVLIFVTGSTTDQLTGLDDNNIRLIQDVSKEQYSIADRLLEENLENLIILRDLDNNKYTEPALKYFYERYGKEVPLLDISVSSWNLEEIHQFLEDQTFDGVYTLIGGNQTASGALAQMAWRINPEAKVFFTPWNNSPNIVDTAGPAIGQCTMASHYPAREDSEVTRSYFEGFISTFNYTPTYNSLHVYRAIELLSDAVQAGKTAPAEIKDWILSTGSFETELGAMRFDQYGDTSLDLFFINDIKKEYE